MTPTQSRTTKSQQWLDNQIVSPRTPPDNGGNPGPAADHQHRQADNFHRLDTFAEFIGFLGQPFRAAPLRSTLEALGAAAIFCVICLALFALSAALEF